MIFSYAHVRTKRADQYLMQLSNKSSQLHAVPQYRAAIMFPIGRCELVANEDYLDLAITAYSMSEATLIEDAISDRLDSIAAGEDLHYQWITAPETPKDKAPFEATRTGQVRPCDPITSA